MAEKKQPASRGPEADAKGQFAEKQHGGDNDGAASAEPRVLSENGDGDATYPIKKEE